MNDLKRLSINQYTTFMQWSLPEAIAGYARHGVHGIAVSHAKLREVGVTAAAKLLRDHDMTVTGYCIGGLLTDSNDVDFQKSLDENHRVIDEAAEIGAQCIVFVAGGLPEGSKDIEGTRNRCLHGLHEIIPYARKAGVTLALEPLHPMTSAIRSCLTTLRQANDWYEQLGGHPNSTPELGIALDVYHVWWEPNLAQEIERAAGRIVAFHVCDWLMDTVDLRLDRGMMGDGVIDIPQIRQLVEAAGYDGFCEVEIFSERDWWQRDPDEVVKIVKERFIKHV
ncbi:MAG: sugar phosphate isomerase/epimerase family protein [Chloroflexota bacterium]